MRIQTSIAGRLAAGVFAASCLLLSSGAAAREHDDAGDPSAAASGDRERIEQLERRVEELETSKTAHEDATRSIIRQSLSTLGSRINEFVTLGGTFELGTRWSQVFGDRSEREILLGTAELDFEIQVNDWTLGSIIFAYDDGKNFTFRSTDEDEVSVDRINVDTAFITIGDTNRFWAYGRFGRMIVPFGISTGAPVADVLTVDNPITLDVFETRRDGMLLGFEFPTPPAGPMTLVSSPPPVRPQLFNPIASGIARSLGYRPPPRRPVAPTKVPAPPSPAPFTAAFYVYDGQTHDRVPRKSWYPVEHFGATLGYRTKVNCRPYVGTQQLVDEPRPSFLHVFCPWTIDVDVDFNRSVFDSSFLAFEYRNFLSRIDFVPGMAASAKATLGPVSLVGEWNGAIKNATFLDDNFVAVKMMPMTWQVSFGYQLDWNPWVDKIGAQGTYVAASYSQSRDLAGVTRVIAGSPRRVGSVPRRRVLVTVGEWVLDGLRLAVEFSHEIDYGKGQGGTGRSANGVFTLLTYEW